METTNAANAGALQLILLVGGLIGLASVICWIVYWVQLAGWKSKLKQKLLLSL